MIPSGLAKRYATALFSTALKKNIADEIQGDVGRFCELIKLNPRLKNFMLSPQVRTEDKISLIRKTLGDVASSTFVNFLELLVQKERFDLTEEIANAFKELYERYLGILEVRITTAVPLDEALERKAIEKLEKETKKKIRLSKSVDPTILGGMVVKMENKIIDGSVRFQLEKLKANLKEVKVY